MLEYILLGTSTLNLILVLVALSNHNDMKHELELNLKGVHYESDALRTLINSLHYKDLDRHGQARADIYRLEAKYDEKFRELKSCKKDYTEGKPCC